MRLGISALNSLLGRRSANKESAERKITALEGMPAMGLDGLGSSVLYLIDAALNPVHVRGLPDWAPAFGFF